MSEQKTKTIKEKYGFKQLSDKEKLEKLKKNSRKYIVLPVKTEDIRGD